MIELAVRVIGFKDEKILLVNNMRDSFFYLPGGKVQLYEDFETAAKREINEETGGRAEFLPTKLMYFQQMINIEKQRHKVEFFIYGEIIEIELVDQFSDPEHNGSDKLEWISIDDLAQINFKPGKLASLLKADFSNKFATNAVIEIT